LTNERFVLGKHKSKYLIPILLNIIIHKSSMFGILFIAILKT